MRLVDIICVIVLFECVWLAFTVPSEYLLGYSKWLRERHGYLFGIFISIYMLVMSVVISIIVIDPGKYPVLEYVAAVFGFASLALAAWDNYTFWKEKYRHRNGIGEN